MQSSCCKATADVSQQKCERRTVSSRTSFSSQLVSMQRRLAYEDEIYQEHFDLDYPKDGAQDLVDIEDRTQLRC